MESSEGPGGAGALVGFSGIVAAPLPPSNDQNPMNPAPEELRTDRLVGRRISPADLDDFRAFYSDAEVMKHLHPGDNPWVPETVSALLVVHVQHWVEHGFGTWIFRDRLTGEFVGRAGLRALDVGEGPVVELFYGLASDRWGRGLATEMARAIVTTAFEELRVPALVAFTLPTNQASRRVLEKCGFAVTGDIMHANLRHLTFRREAGAPAPAGRPLAARTRRPAKMSESATTSGGSEELFGV